MDYRDVAAAARADPAPLRARRLPLPLVPAPPDNCYGNHHVRVHRHHPAGQFHGHAVGRHQLVLPHHHRQPGAGFVPDVDPHNLRDPLRASRGAGDAQGERKERCEGCVNSHCHDDGCVQARLPPADHPQLPDASLSRHGSARRAARLQHQGTLESGEGVRKRDRSSNLLRAAPRDQSPAQLLHVRHRRRP